MQVEAGGQTISVSNAERVIFPRDGISKGDLVGYYRDIAPVMVPHLAGRPLALHRFPRGIDGEAFYQKRTPGFFPKWIPRAEVAVKDGKTTMSHCDDAACLVYIANQNCITPHTWMSRADDLLHPDLLMIDLDPADDESYGAVRDTAFAARDRLAQRGLPSFVKTSGSKGLHVVVPLDRTGTFEDSMRLADQIADELVRRDPDHLTLEFSKADRGGRIYVDIGRNTWAQHAACAYAVRPRDGAPVSTPLTWDELARPDVHARTFTLANARNLLEERPCPWTDLWAHAASVQT